MSQLMVGDIILGGARGMFEYHGGPRRVEALGADWVVARNSKGEPEFACDEGGFGGRLVHPALWDACKRNPNHDPSLDEEE